MFPPLAFYGAYRIFTDESPRAFPYSILALAIAGTALSHPYTAFLEVLALLLMAAFRYKDCIRLVKEKGFWVRILPAAGLALFLVLPFLVPMAGALSSGSYLVSDEEVMWTEAGHLVGTVPMSMQYAGFLNFPWRDQYQPGGVGDTFLSWTLGLVLYPVAIGLSYALDLFLRKRSGLEGWTLFLTRALALLLFTLGVPLLMGARLELFLAFLLYFLCYLVMVMLPPGEEERERLSLLSRGAMQEKIDFRMLLGEGELFSGILTMGLALIALFVPYFWRIAPSFLRLCQFPFRWWGFFWMGFLLFLLPLLRLGRGRKEAAPIALGLSIFFLVIQMATVDKRIWAVEKGNGHNVEPTVSSVSEIDHFGHQNEYFPRIIYDIFDGKAESEYPDSLVHTLGKDIPSGSRSTSPPCSWKGRAISRSSPSTPPRRTSPSSRRRTPSSSSPRSTTTATRGRSSGRTGRGSWPASPPWTASWPSRSRKGNGRSSSATPAPYRGGSSSPSPGLPWASFS